MTEWQVDPLRVADDVREKDAYLIPYLLGWFGMADPQPWGAAMSFALEIAHGYGRIQGESDATATPLGLEVAEHLYASAGEAGTATTPKSGVVHEHATGAAGDAQKEGK